jgi:hypothetical protein
MKPVACQPNLEQTTPQAKSFPHLDETSAQKNPIFLHNGHKSNVVLLIFVVAELFALFLESSSSICSDGDFSA